MKHRFASAAIAAAILVTFASSAVSQADKEWVDIKGEKKLRALYSNKTLRGKTPSGVAFVGHYRADGTGVLIMNDQRIPRTWAVKGNDRVCITQASGTDCYTFERHRTKPNQIIGRNVAQPWHVEMTVEDGIPKF